MVASFGRILIIAMICGETVTKAFTENSVGFKIA